MTHGQGPTFDEKQPIQFRGREAFNALESTVKIPMLIDDSTTLYSVRMLTALLLLVVPSIAPPARIADVGWLHGCWDLKQNGRHTIEQWSAPEGGTMIGTSRSVADGVTKEFEFLMIREGTDGRLEYVARPSGQAMAVFTAVRASADEVVFENPQHDFPTRIIYRRTSDGGLLAAVEGNRGGQTRRIEYPYVAATCG